MAKSRKKESSPLHSWSCAAVVAAALIAHGLCLGSPFYMDDQPHILTSPRMMANNPNVADAPLFPALVSNSWNAELDYKGAGQRFVPYLLWNLVHVTAGFSSPAFHALNLLIHTLTATLVFLTARELLEPRARLPGKTIPPSRTPLFAALLFAVHPLGSEIPHYAAQTSIALVTLFSLLASFCVLRWLRNFQWRWVFGAAGSFLLAALSKEVGTFHAGMNGLFILLALAPFRDLKKHAGKRFGLFIAGAVLLLAAVVYVICIQGFFKIPLAAFPNPLFLDHLLTQSRVFWEYAQRAIFPVNLCSDHFVPRTVSSADSVAWVAATGLALLLVTALAGFWKGKRVVALIGALALSHLLLRFLYLSPEVMVEYRTYPSMPWMAMLAALGIAFLFKKTPGRAAPASIVVVIVLTLLSLRRGADWRSEEAIVDNINRQYPLQVRSHSYLQFKDLHAGRFDAVIERQSRVQKNLNAILAFNGSKAGRNRQYDIGQALAGFMVGEHLVGYALVQLDRPADAVGRMTEVIEKMRSFFQDDDSRAFGVLYRARGKAKAALGDKDGARADYNACFERKPDDTEVLRLLKELEKL